MLMNGIDYVKDRKSEAKEKKKNWIIQRKTSDKFNKHKST